MSPEVQQYIDSHLRKGIDSTTIKHQFLTHGWDEQKIDAIFEEYMRTRTTHNSIWFIALKMTGLHIGVWLLYILPSLIIGTTNPLLFILYVPLAYILIPITIFLFAKKYRIVQKPLRVVLVTYVGADIIHVLFEETNWLIALLGFLISIYLTYYLQISGLQRSTHKK